MLRKIVIVIYCVLAIAFLLTGCNTKNINSDLKDNSNMISYDKYKDLIKNMSSSIEVENFTKTGDTLNNGTLTRIDKYTSFGKREYLTLSGEYSMESTQDRIAFEDSKNGLIVFIDSIYTESVMENNFLYHSSNFINKYDDVKSIQSYCDDLISFNNLLFKISIYAKGTKLDVQYLNSFTTQVVKYLSEYKFN